MKEKWIQINKIEGYEDVKDCYWISNADEDKIMNRDTGRMLKISLDKNGYKRILLKTISGKPKECKIHALKARAFIFSPNPLGYDVVRHLNDIRTDNRLINLAWGTISDNTKDSIRNGRYNYEGAIRGLAKGRAIGGAITGAMNGKKRSKPVRCIETEVIYASARAAERQTKISNVSINGCCRGKYKTSGGYHWEFVD